MRITIPNPETKQLRQLNKGNLYGELYGTYNCDLLSAPGKIRVSPRLYRVFDNDTSDSGDSDFKHQWGFVRADTSAGTADQWWSGNGSVLFKSTNSSPTSAWAQDAIATGDGTPTNLSHFYSDIVRFEGAIIVSNSTDLHRLAAASWDLSWWDTTLAQTALTADIYHPLHTWERTLLIGDANKLHTIDKDNIVSASRLVLPPEFYITKIISRIDKAWILTRHIYDGEAMIFEWDGKSNTHNRQFSAKASQCLSGVVSKNGIAYVMNSYGQLLEYTGSGFEEVNSLPLFTETVFRFKGTTAGAIWNDSWSLNRMVHPNGMAMIDDKIHILLSGAIAGTDSYLFENMLSGVWIYTKENGLYHAYSLTQYKSGTQPDKGTGVILYPGALVQTDKGYFLAGGTIYTDNMATELSSIFIKDTGLTRNLGYVIYSRISSSEIQNIWNNIWLKFSQLDSGDKIIVKKRTSRDYNLPVRAAITWTSGTTFTTTESTFSNVAVGDEVQVFVGKNSGRIAHITIISLAAGTYTITIDETMLITSGTAQIYVYDWVKVGSFSDSDSLNRQFTYFALGGESTYIDIKIVFDFFNERSELEDATITSKTNLKIE